MDLAYRISFVDRSYPHHGRFSGYKRLADYMPGRQSSGSPFLSLFPDQLFYRIPGTNRNWYSKQALERELAILPGLLLDRGTIYHYLYGEASLKLGGFANSMRRRNRIIATFHQIPSFFEAREQIYARILRSVDCIIAVSTTLLPTLSTLAAEKSVRWVPHGVDVDFFKPPPMARHNTGPLRCLTVGSNYRDVNMHVGLITMVNRASRGDIQFVVVGDERFAPLYLQLANTRYLTAISDEDLLRAYHDADICALPLLDATASNGLLEAMAVALPIVVTEVGGVRDYVDERSACLVPKGDVKAMASAVLSLAGSPDSRLTMGAAARHRAASLFSWQAIVRQMLGVYASVW